MSWVRSGLVLALGLGCSCSLFTDLEGLDRGAPTPDASLGLLDGGAIVDAGEDHSTLAETDAGETCEPQDLCEDFDGHATRTWTIANDPNSELTVDGVHAHSGNLAAHFRKPVGPSVAGGARLTFDSLPAVARCSFWIWVDQSVGSSMLEHFLYFEPTPKGDGFRRILRRGVSGTRLLEQAPTNDVKYVDGPPLSARAWHHVISEMTDTSYAITVDGARAEKALELRPSNTSASKTLIFGVNYEEPTDTTWDVFIDDIICKYAK